MGLYNTSKIVFYKTVKVSKKVINKPKEGTLRAKWLKEFKEEESLRILIRFKKRNIGKCYKTAVG